MSRFVNINILRLSILCELAISLSRLPSNLTGISSFDALLTFFAEAKSTKEPAYNATTTVTIRNILYLKSLAIKNFFYRVVKFKSSSPEI